MNDKSEKQQQDDLGKIQDILFGQQQRQANDQLKQLEARMNEQISLLQQSHAAMDEKLKRLQNEKTDRKALSSLLMQMAKQIAD